MPMSLGDFKRAINYHMLGLTIAKEVGDRAGEGGDSSRCIAYIGLRNFKEATLHCEQFLQIGKQRGGKDAEGHA